MKIGFCGAGGTGKSTLAKAISEMHKLPFMKSPSRECFEKHGVLTEDAQRALTPKQRFALQLDIFKAIDKQVFGNVQGVFDRTHLDNLGYCALQCHDVVGNEQFTEMWEIAAQGLKTFDLIIYCPLYDWRSVNDGMRTQNLAARKLHDAFVFKFLHAESIPHINMLNVGIQERLMGISQHMAFAGESIAS